MLICLPACLFTCLSTFKLIKLTACLSFCLSVCLSVYLSTFLPICLSTCLPAWLCLSICFPTNTPRRFNVESTWCVQGVCLCICLSVSLSVCLQFLRKYIDGMMYLHHQVIKSNTQEQTIEKVQVNVLYGKLIKNQFQYENFCSQEFFNFIQAAGYGCATLSNGNLYSIQYVKIRKITA